MLDARSDQTRRRKETQLAASSEVRDCGKLIQSLKERGIQQMCCFVILLLFNEMQISVLRFSAIPHLRGGFHRGKLVSCRDYRRPLEIFESI